MHCAFPVPHSSLSHGKDEGLQQNSDNSETQALPAGTREMIMACCAFGNSLTLPLVFLSSLLPAAAYQRAVGYTALFLAGWC